MNRQRGLAMIAIYAIAAGAIALGLVGWWEYHNYQIRSAEKAKWQAAMKACTENTEAAVNANKTLVASTEQLAAKVSEQNARIDALAKAEGVARKERNDLLAAALAKEQSLRAEIVRLTVIANAPPVTTTVEVCNEAADILRAVAASRM